MVAKGTKKILPKDFESMIKRGDIDELKAVYDTCHANARWGVAAFKQTALALNDCPDELARWLIERGADIQISDYYGISPLHARAQCWDGHVDILLELGADVNAGEGANGTPLHSVTNTYNLDVTRSLIAHGAKVNALDEDKLSPLAYALQQCNGGHDLQYIVPFAELLLKAGARKTVKMKKFVARIGKGFEGYRASVEASEAVDADTANDFRIANDAMDKLYELFDVEPAPRRVIVVYDGKSPIIARADKWGGQFNELWELLVPAIGAADTVQGEVIRISGKVERELNGNGGGNWDAEYKKLVKAFLVYIQLGTSLPSEDITEAKSIVRSIKSMDDELDRLCEMAVDWVALNPNPVKLETPEYTR